MRPLLLAALVGASLITACGGDDGPSAPAKTAAQKTGQPTASIRITDFAFEPATATVKAGQEISVRNEDAAPHTLTHEAPSSRRAFDSGTIEGRATGSITIDEPGSYRFFCELHAFMRGEVTVTR